MNAQLFTSLIVLTIYSPPGHRFVARSGFTARQTTISANQHRDSEDSQRQLKQRAWRRCASSHSSFALLLFCSNCSRVLLVLPPLASRLSTLLGAFYTRPLPFLYSLPLPCHSQKGLTYPLPDSDWPPGSDFPRPAPSELSRAILPRANS